ncbi:unnamed protein product, partial [Brenthis ino]
MDHKEEYHDPDYPEVSATIVEEPPSESEDDKVVKIKKIIRREFKNELNVRENEVLLIDQRMTTARRYLHQVRYALVNNFYKDQKLQLTNDQIEDDVAAQTEPRARAEVSSILRDNQRRLHPSVRKLLGKKIVDIEEIFRSREPRNKTRKNYYAMLQRKNYTISADATTSLRPNTDKEEKIEVKQEYDKEEPGTSKPKKIPRQIDPKVNNVVTLDEVTRNKKKHRYRIIIGNTSKYAPPASRQDRSTHKWLLYVRAPPPRDASRVLRAVHVQLHRSYAPHHAVYIDKPPFQVSRRGWGEFPARVTLHFTLPDINRPATVTHTIKLDRHYTGLQTLGAETIADVWLYSTPDMLECEFKPEEETYLEKPIQQIKQEVDDTETEPVTPKIQPVKTKTELVKPKVEPNVSQNDSWLEFFNKDTTEVNVDEMLVKNIKRENEVEAKCETEVSGNEVTQPSTGLTNGDKIVNEPKKRIMKYIDPTTGKIYYLEMDRKLDLSKVKEIVINSQGEVQTAKISPIKNGLKAKRFVSCLKPEVKNQLRTEIKVKTEYSHIENDHCYLKTNWCKPIEVKRTYLDDLKGTVAKFSCTYMVVNFLLKKMALISDSMTDVSLPFVVQNEDKYWKLDFTKRRNMEWSRAKLINKILTEQFKAEPNKVWRTKQILIFSRLHGFYPVKAETVLKQDDTSEWSSWDDLENSRKTESNIRKLYPDSNNITSLTLFNSDRYMQCNETRILSDSDEEIDITSDEQVKVKSEVLPDSTDMLEVLPVQCKEDKLKFFYIESKCADIGIELRNEDVGEGYSYSAVHAVLLSAMKNFAEDLLRSALADQTSMANDPQLPTIWTGSDSRTRVRLEHVWRAVRGRPALSRAALGARRHVHHAV